MSRAKFVQHVNIQTTNRARTKEWYEKVFDAEAIERGNAQPCEASHLRGGA